MNEQELAQFVEWLPSSIEEFKDKTPEEIVTTLNKMSQTEEGMNTISTLIDQFKRNSSKIFKSGGKLNYLINKFKNGKPINTPKGPIRGDEEGGYKDIDGRDAGYKEGYFKERAAQKAADRLAEQEFRSDSTYHALPEGPIYTRSTFYPFSTDTIVSRDGKFYSNSLGRSVRKFVTGTSPFDQINRAIDSIGGYSTPRYDRGGEVKKNKDIKWNILGAIGEGDNTQFVEQFTYPNGVRKQAVSPKTDSTGVVHLGFPEVTRIISGNNADTLYQDRVGRIMSGPIEDNLSLFGLNMRKIPYTPWNKDRKLQELKARKAAIVEKFNKMK